MHSKWVFKHFRPQESRYTFVLVLLWSIGLLLGILLCGLSPYDIVDVLYGTFYAKPSMFSLFLASILPVLFAVASVHTSLYLISCPSVFLSALSHGFCGAAIYIAFGSAAWLLRPMVLFSAGCTSVLMWWLLFQRNTGRRMHKHICLALCLSCLVYIVDLFLVSPLVGDLIKVL